MLERLFASMVNGPAMNCRPHASRQRLDVASLGRLKSVEPGAVLLATLGEARQVSVVARVPAPARAMAVQSAIDADDEDETLSPEDKAARRAWSEQQAVLNKLRVVADDARTYEQDTGVHVLDIGFPLLSLPPGTFGGRGGIATRRILAPIAFIPITLTVKTGAKPSVAIACHGEGIDLVRPNVALLAWLEQQTGQPMADLYADEAGENPWREVVDLVKAVAARVEVDVPELFDSDALPAAVDLRSTPRTDEDESLGKAIVCSAVLGLFPTSNQGLLRDTRELVAEGAADGPIESFVRLGTSLDAAEPKGESEQVAGDASADIAAPVQLRTRTFGTERLISHADPCQTRAVRMARECRGLVVHGPPGTGKSQTIANVIGDHLARGERVLFVCDKRTALDVVADRLQSLGIGNLLATVHDPQRDQREFYRSVRDQLDSLAESSVTPGTELKLSRIDEELQTLHDELSDYYKSLMGRQGGPGSFHHLVGQWLNETGDVGTTVDERPLQQIPAADFDRHAQRLKEVLSRGEAVGYADNPWVAGAGIGLPAFLELPMNVLKSAASACTSKASATDASLDPYLMPFAADADVTAEAERRRSLADALRVATDFPADSVRHWTQQSATAVRTAIETLNREAALVEQISAKPSDPQLFDRACRVGRAETATIDVTTLREYATAFRAKMHRFQAAVAAAGEGSDEVVLKWMAAPDAKASAARKRLDGVAALANRIDKTTLDASLSARMLAAPIDATKAIEWLAALNGYLDIAGKWTAIFKSGVKKAAEPAVRHFGLSLNPGSATQVRQFLADLQERDDLRAAVGAATGVTFDDRPDDAELLTHFRHNHDALKSLSAAAPPTEATETDGPIHRSAAATIAVNHLVTAQSAAVETTLRRFDLEITPEPADRLGDFAEAIGVRLRVVDLLNAHALPVAIDWPVPADDQLISAYHIHLELLRLLDRVGVGTPIGEAVGRVLTNAPEGAAILNGLATAPARARVILDFEKVVDDAGLFSTTQKAKFAKAVRANRPVTKGVEAFADRLDSLEGVLRVDDGLKRLPPSLSGPAATLLSHRCKAADGYSVVRRNVLAGEITRRLRQSPQLQAVDGHRLQASFERFRQLSERKKELVRDDVLNRWTTKQKERLLASTGTRLNGMGADLRRRLTMRGDKAMRLRQVIAHGRSVDGGDPLFDLRPVWMASPETVAQLFNREPLFDVIVFDEASQCRLEEALPVLTRGKRIVVAGDPKQLPPTRFFESAVATSEDVDAETDQELFEAHQGEVEDLLTAALSLDGVDECYLNVHYRSRNSDLIGFSNDHFYGSRLQAIPGHPKNRIRYAPITLHRADGVYEKRRNVAEAARVCQIVHDLLRRGKPPSIGIACFNMVQRDLIVETLEEWAGKDADFASKLAEARERRGHGSSEGLFVKNLENVQGDERDHLIISTTYGPDKNGKFRRSFGPLGMAGGGRRLNVLVTRAREELHVVTSIPRSAYASLPDVPQGSTPSGAWLLFAYLNYAEHLKEEYETIHRILESSGPTEVGSVYARPSKTPSHFAKALGAKLATTANASSEVHWGNEGFCVDLAMMNPTKAEDVTIGIQCDMTRFAGSDDPVEWDTFQTMIHESQGWKLHRVWTPHFFRDPDGVLSLIRDDVHKAMSTERL
jgi:hypothetical protein